MQTFDFKIDLGRKKEEFPQNLYIGLTTNIFPIRFFSLEIAQQHEAIMCLFSFKLVDVLEKIDIRYAGQSYKHKEYCELFYEANFDKVNSIKINEFECIRIEYSYTTQFVVYHGFYFGCFDFYIVDKNGEVRKERLYSSYNDQSYRTIDNLITIYDDLLKVNNWKEYDDLQIKEKEKAEKKERESMEWQQQDKEKRMCEAKELLGNINQIIKFIAEKYDLTIDETLELIK